MFFMAFKKAVLQGAIEQFESKSGSKNGLWISGSTWSLSVQVNLESCPDLLDQTLI